MVVYKYIMKILSEIYIAHEGMQKCVYFTLIKLYPTPEAQRINLQCIRTWWMGKLNENLILIQIQPLSLICTHTTVLVYICDSRCAIYLFPKQASVQPVKWRICSISYSIVVTGCHTQLPGLGWGMRWWTGLQWCSTASLLSPRLHASVRCWPAWVSAHD